MAIDNVCDGTFLYKTLMCYVLCVMLNLLRDGYRICT